MIRERELVFPPIRFVETRPHFALADAVRAVAILAVVAHHIAQMSGFTLMGHRLQLPYLAILGVDAFFVLSGYLIGAPYVRAIVDGRRLPDLRLFAQRRFLRIFPLYALAVVTTAPLVYRHTGLHAALKYLASHLTFTHGFMLSEITAGDNPLWTMAVDAQFYVCLPIIAAAVAWGTRGRKRRTRTVALALVLAAWIPASLLFRTLTLHYLAPTFAWTNVALYGRNIIGVGSDFALGAGIALLAMIRVSPSRLAAVGWLITGATFAVVVARFANPDSTALEGQVCYDLFGGIAVAATLYGLAAFPKITRLCGVKPVVRLAELAYAIYLFHYPLLPLVRGFLNHDSVRRALHIPPPADGPLYSLAFAIGEVGLVLPIAWLAHRIIERPFLELRDSRRDPVIPQLP